MFAVIVASALLVAPGAEAGDPERDTHITLTHDVRVPGATLPAGSYVFVVNREHSAAWIHAEGSNRVYGPFLTRARLAPGTSPERRVVLMPATGEDETPWLRAWFGRNQRLGHELIYPSAF